MSIKRYVREGYGRIYDRLKRKYIKVRREKQIGNQYYINAQAPDEIVISMNQIEE